jgi:hypothetical protein
MSDVACDRDFTMLVDGEPRRVFVEWRCPTRWRGDWECRFTIYWPDRDADELRGIGVDSTQALLLAMNTVSVLLEQRSVYWLDGGFGLGLPDPSGPLSA